MRAHAFVAAVLLLSVGVLGQGRDLYDIQVDKITDHVYVAIRPEPLREYVEGNVTIIVNDRDVVLVDAGGAPSSAARVIAAIKRITPLPVRYIVFTHIHRDHRFGAQAYLDTYPGVEIIGHPNVQRVIADSGDAFVAATIARLEKERAGGAAVIEHLQRERAAGSERVIAHLKRYYDRDLPRTIEEYRKVRNVSPSLTVADRLTLHRGHRTIEIRHLGKGDTPEDLVVHLPQDRVTVAGDMVVAPIPYGFSAQPREWAATLQKLAALDFDYLVPGHGGVQHDKSYVHRLIETITSIQDQVTRARTKGLDLEATRRMVRVSGDSFTNGDPVAAYYFQEWFFLPAIERAYRSTQ